MAFNTLTRRAGAPYDPDDLTREINENFASCAEVSLATVADGELLVYDGSSGVWINRTVSELALDLNDLSDVTVATPADNDVLLYDASSSAWLNVTGSAFAATIDLDDIGNVTVGTLADGEVLVWDSSSNSWINGTASTVAAINDLTDVSIATPADGEVLTYDASSNTWINAAAAGGGSSTLSGLTDTTITSPTDGSVLTYDAATSSWVNEAGTTTLVDRTYSDTLDFSAQASRTWDIPANCVSVKVVPKLETSATAAQTISTTLIQQADGLAAGFNSITQYQRDAGSFQGSGTATTNLTAYTATGPTVYAAVTEIQNPRSSSVRTSVDVSGSIYNAAAGDEVAYTFVGICDAAEDHDQLQIALDVGTMTGEVEITYTVLETVVYPVVGDGFVERTYTDTVTASAAASATWNIPDNCISFKVVSADLAVSASGVISAVLNKQSDGTASSFEVATALNDGTVTGGQGTGTNLLSLTVGSGAYFTFDVSFPRSTTSKAMGVSMLIDDDASDRTYERFFRQTTAEDVDEFVVSPASGTITGELNITYTVLEANTGIQKLEFTTATAMTLSQAPALVESNHAGAVTHTLPASAPTGTKITFTQTGAGTPTIQAPTGETLNGVTVGSIDIGSQYASITFLKNSGGWTSEGGTYSSLDVVGDLTVDTNLLVVDATNDFVGVGTGTPDEKLEVSGLNGTTIKITQTQNTASSTAALEFEQVTGGGAQPGGKIESVRVTSTSFDMDFYTTTGGSHSLGAVLTRNGDYLVGPAAAADTNNPGNGNTTVGHSAQANGTLYSSRNGSAVHFINRNTTDGPLVSLRQDGTEEGTISVSGTTVSYNNFLGSHYSEIAGQPQELLPGTIVRATGTPVQNRFERSGRLSKVEVSDAVGDRGVYGVIVGPDFEDDDEDGNSVGEGRNPVRRQYRVGAVGVYGVRIAAGTVVQKDDLIESAGDGTGRPQADDIFRSSTVAKITSLVPMETYPDGSRLFPATLHCG